MRIRPRGGVVAVVGIVLAMFAGAGGVSAAGATLRIDPGTQTVSQGATFTVKIIQNAPMLTAGTSATVTFDQTKVQMQSVTFGAAHANAEILVPSDMNGAIAAANSSGNLHNVASDFTPPDSVPAGNQDFLIITFKATGCGTVNLGLPVGRTDSGMLDGTDAHYGEVLTVTTTGGSVTIDCSGGPTSSPEATSTETLAPGATPGPTSASKTAGPAVDTSQPAADAPTAVASSSTETVAGATSSSGSDGGFLLWLPVFLSVPAVAIVGLGLLRSRRPMTS